MVKLRWVQYEYESKMSMKIEDPKQEWKSLIARLRAKTRTKTKTMSIGNEQRQAVIMGSCKNKYKTKLITCTLV